MKSIKNFYNEDGWKNTLNNSKDAELFEDLRPSAKKYVSKCRLRILKHIPKNGGSNILDFASGPIQYNEYLKFSKNFKKRHCVDFSKIAIDKAKKKLGSKGKYYCKDFLKINFKKNYFDCVVSLHTIYHIHKSKQAMTIKKLIDISKKDSPIIIVYSNPNTFINYIKKIFFIKKKIKKDKLYFFCHKNNWWQQFSDLADVKLYPWRSFSSQHQKLLIPGNKIGQLIFKLLFLLEERFPSFFVKFFQYQIIVLKKK